MSNRKAAAILAGAILFIGLVVGYWPLSTDRGYVTEEHGDTVACGSAFGGLSSEADAAEFGGAIRDIYDGGDGSDDGGYVELCQGKVSSQRVIAFVVGGLGALGLAFLGLTRPQAPPTAAPQEEQPPAQPAGDAST